MVTPYSSTSAWQSYTPGNTAYTTTPTNRPLPVINSGDTYTALSLPIQAAAAAPGGQPLTPFDGYGVRKVGEPGAWTAMSR